jgi:two-component system cell cycle response regulator
MNAARSQTKILIVDDDAMIRDVLRGVLEQDLYATLEAPDAKAGLEAAVEHFPQLIIVDMRMPRMSGLEFLKAARAHPDIRHIPVLIVTAYQSASDGLECLEAGAAGYVQKPIKTAAFRRQIKTLLGHPL